MFDNLFRTPVKFIKNMEKGIILAIETAFEGGSVSILEGQTQIDFWIGADNTSKSEDILDGIRLLLQRNNLKKIQIGLVAVSSEAGSLTGLKIGLATAQGLAKALGCPLLEVPMWRAIARSLADIRDQEVVVLLPGGKTTVGIRKWLNRKFVSEVELINISDLGKMDVHLDFGKSKNSILYAHHKLTGLLKYETFAEIRNFDENLSNIIGHFASDNQERLERW